MKLNGKSIYAQSSDIKSRTYLEYRKDMKKKAIAELEVLAWLEKKIKKLHPKDKVAVKKYGGDKFLWFLRKGGVSREPDYCADIGEKRLNLEFQYADKANLPFYDFKVSKVAKKIGDVRKPIKDKLFAYIHKPLLKYAFFSPEWIMKNGEYGMVPAWRSYAFRVPKDKFEKKLTPDHSLKIICRVIDIKNFILNYQHELINIYKEKFSHLLQSVIDENQLVKIIPKNLDSFFRICFILDNIEKFPENANLWLIYLLSYISKTIKLEDVSKILYCLDFLYCKIILKPNELEQLVNKINVLLSQVKSYYRADGSFCSTLRVSPLEEIRYALFSINLIEDLTQDLIFYYSVKDLKPINKIYENVENIEKTYELIKDESSLNSS